MKLIGRHVFDHTSLTDESIGARSPDIYNRAQWVRHVDISQTLIRSKHCENESGDCMYRGRLYVSYHEVFPRTANGSHPQCSHFILWIIHNCAHSLNY